MFAIAKFLLVFEHRRLVSILAMEVDYMIKIHK